MAGIVFAYHMNKAGYDRGYDEGYTEAWNTRSKAYDKGYDRGYQACVEEYNLYLPLDY